MWADSDDNKTRACPKWRLLNLVMSTLPILITVLVLMESASEMGDRLISVAGSMLIVSKIMFLNGHRHEVTNLIRFVNQKGLILKAKAEEDTEIRKLRNHYFLTEFVLSYSVFIFSITFQSCIFLQGAILHPSHLVIPTKIPFDWDQMIGVHILMFTIQFVTATWASVCVSLSDFMIGNAYNQVSGHFQRNMMSVCIMENIVTLSYSELKCSMMNYSMH